MPMLRPALVATLALITSLAATAPAQTVTWKPLGPNPEANAPADDETNNEESGRILSIAIHPTDPKIVFIGTAGGGLYRSTDGGNNWLNVPLPPPAGAVGQSLAIGALAFAPS